MAVPSPGDSSPHAVATSTPGKAPTSTLDTADAALTPEPAKAESRGGMLAPLAVPAYRWYFFLGLLVSSAFGMQNLAFAWLTYELTGSPAKLGLNLLAMAVPQICLSFVGGVVADRISKRVIMMGTFSGAALIYLIVGVAQQAQVLNYWYLMGASFGMGAVTSFQMPSRQGIISQLVGRDRLTAAIALNQANQNATQLAAPALAGFMIAEVGISSVFFFMAGLYVISILALFPMRYSFTPPKAKWTVAAMFKNMIDGWSYVRKNSNVRTILLFSLLTTTFAMPYTVLLPVLAKDVLHTDAKGLGLLLSVSGVGAFIGSVLMTSAGKTKRGMLFLHTALVTAIALAFLSVSTFYGITMLVMGVLGLASAARMSLPNILLQHYSDDAYLGRVLSLFLLQFGVTSLGGWGVAAAAQFIGVQWALAGSTACLMAITVAYYAFSRSMKQLA